MAQPLRENWLSPCARGDVLSLSPPYVLSGLKRSFFRMRAFRLPWQRPEEPPPPQSVEWWFGGPAYTLGAVILWCFYTRGCIALERGHLGRLQPHHAWYTFWCFPLAVMVHAVSYFSEEHGTGEVDFLSSLSGRSLDHTLLLHLGAPACRGEL